jgi:transcriptional regulator with XRE-family HTH domain
VASTCKAMKLRELLQQRAGVTSAQAFGRRLGLSKQHASSLWYGRDPLGLRLMRQIKQAYGISLDDLAEVEEAVPGQPRARSVKRPEPTPASVAVEGC